MTERINPEQIVSSVEFGDPDYGPVSGIDVTVIQDSDIETLAQRTYRYFIYNYQDPFRDYELLAVYETTAIVRIYVRMH